MLYEDKVRLLMKKTLALLKKDKRTPLEISMETGINFYWLKKFKDGAIKNPSVNKVEFIHEFLTGNKLNV